MIFDIKYHIASLTAVFLALGIGILIGTFMIGGDAVSKQQKDMIEDIEKQFAILREENRESADALLQAQAEISFQQQLNQSVLPVLLKDKLVERQVALVDINYDKEHDRLDNILRSAGADVQSATIINLDLLNDGDLNNQVVEMLNKPEDTELEDYLPDLAQQISEAILTGEISDLISLLYDHDVIKVSGSYGLPLHDIVLFGGSADKEKDYFKVFDQMMIETWRLAGINTYGVENSDVDISYMRYYQNAQLTTVDSIDTAYGQVSLVMAMYGYPGQYGIKETADVFLPPLE